MKLFLEPLFQDIFDTYKEKLGKDNIFLVGGFVRDRLLKRETTDMDFACALSPEEVSPLVPEGTYVTPFGTFSFKVNQVHVTLACMRKDLHYSDSRHPDKLLFVSSIQEEYQRRDFTMNCLYLNHQNEILDPTGLGIKDIQDKKIRIIGSKERFIEDPLRILRAYRFKNELGFDIEEKTLSYIQECQNELLKIKLEKIKAELRKMDEDSVLKMREQLSILSSLDI